jgi:hypothetical protein
MKEKKIFTLKTVYFGNVHWQLFQIYKKKIPSFKKGFKRVTK